LGAFDPYKVLISIEILQLKRPSKRDRELILKFLESLADVPDKRGDLRNEIMLAILSKSRLLAI
jgi:hypothetical protein